MFTKKATKVKHQEVWVISDQEEVKVCDMTEEYAKNCLNLLLKRERVRRGKSLRREIRDLEGDYLSTF